MKTQALALIALLAAAGAQAAVRVPPAAREAVITLPDGFRVRARLALSAEEHAYGLMFVKSLEPDRGMLFVFPDEGTKLFWMKNTFVELDIVFLSAEMEAGRIFHRIPASFYGQPESEVARASAPARFVLELAGGVARAHGLKKGSKLGIVFYEGKKGASGVPSAK